MSRAFYTDADVHAMLGALRSHLAPDVRYLVDDPECREQVEVMLAAVAPTIAARALRGLAETWGRPLVSTSDVHAHADQIEAGR